MTTTPTTPAAELYVDEFMITAAGSHGRPLYFSTDDEKVYPENPRLGEVAGLVVVRVGVDLGHDAVAMDENHCSRIALLNAAISDLQRVPGHARAAAKDADGERGPVHGRGGLESVPASRWARGSVSGQTEAQWQANRNALAAARARRASRAG